MRCAWWINEITDEPLDAATMHELRLKARRLYEMNTHIFEDECEALAALGAVPIMDARAL